MSKRKSKAITKASKAKAITRASAAKAAVTKSSAAPAASSVPLIVLGFDDQQKPRGARFDHDKPDLVTKAAELMDLKVYQATSEDVAAIAEKLPVGRLYANGRGFVPNIRQDLYSDLIVALALEPAGGAEPGKRQGQPPRCPRPAADLGRGRAWPSRHCSRVARLRLVGGDRH